MAPQASKISVNTTVKTLLEIWDKHSALLPCVNEIADDALNCLGMGVLGAVRESGHLVHCKLDVRSGVGGQIEEHSNGSWMTPLFLEWGAILVGAKWFLGCRSGFGSSTGHSTVHVVNKRHRVAFGRVDR